MLYHTKLYLIVIGAWSAKALGIMFADYSNAFMCPPDFGLPAICEAHTTIRAWWKDFYYVVNLVQ